MKKISCFALILVLCFSLVACAGGEDKRVLDIKEVAFAINDKGLFIDKLEPVREEVISKAFGVDTSNCTAVEYYWGSGAEGEEFGVFECKTADDAKEVLKQVTARRDSLIKEYASYNVKAVPRLEGAVLEQTGKYVIFISAEKSKEAAELVTELLK
ncbi:MAG: DUF4358 domain-containing protein [Oscillospiraceae bacterium]